MILLSLRNLFRSISNYYEVIYINLALFLTVLNYTDCSCPPPQPDFRERGRAFSNVLCPLPLTTMLLLYCPRALTKELNIKIAKRSAVFFIHCLKNNYADIDDALLTSRGQQNQTHKIQVQTVYKKKSGLLTGTNNKCCIEIYLCGNYI